MSTFLTGEGDINVDLTLDPASEHVIVQNGSGTAILGGLAVNLDRITYPFFLPSDHQLTGGSLTGNADVLLPPLQRTIVSFTFPNTEAVGLVVGDQVDLPGLTASAALPLNTSFITSIDRAGSDAVIGISIQNNHSFEVTLDDSASPSVTLNGGGHLEYEFPGGGYIAVEDAPAATRTRNVDLVDADFTADNTHYNNNFGADVLAGQGSAIIKTTGTGPDRKVNLSEINYPIALTNAGTITQVSGFVVVRERTAVAANISTVSVGSKDDGYDATVSQRILSGAGRVLCTITPTTGDATEFAVNLEEDQLPLIITLDTGETLNIKSLKGRSVIHRQNA